MSRGVVNQPFQHFPYELPSVLETARALPQRRSPMKNVVYVPSPAREEDYYSSEPRRRWSDCDEDDYPERNRWVERTPRNTSYHGEYDSRRRREGYRDWRDEYNDDRGDLDPRERRYVRDRYADDLSPQYPPRNYAVEGPTPRRRSPSRRIVDVRQPDATRVMRALKDVGDNGGRRYFMIERTRRPRRYSRHDDSNSEFDEYME